MISSTTTTLLLSILSMTTLINASSSISTSSTTTTPLPQATPYHTDVFFTFPTATLIASYQTTTTTLPPSYLSTYTTPSTETSFTSSTTDLPSPTPNYGGVPFHYDYFGWTVTVMTETPATTGTPPSTHGDPYPTTVECETYSPSQTESSSSSSTTPSSISSTTTSRHSHSTTSYLPFPSAISRGPQLHPSHTFTYIVPVSSTSSSIIPTSTQVNSCTSSSKVSSDSSVQEQTLAIQGFVDCLVGVIANGSSQALIAIKGVVPSTGGDTLSKRNRKYRLNDKVEAK